MRRTEENITITIKGLARTPEIFVVPRRLGRELHALISGKPAVKSAAAVLPELADDTQRPASILRGLRHREKLTQKTLADLLGVRQHHLSEMENGKRPIGKEMAKKMAGVLRADWRIFL